LGYRAVFQPTAGHGDGETLALKAASDGYAIVAAAGGDGTVHEVANGILRAARPDVALAVLPVGSANDYAHSLGLDGNWWVDFDRVTGFRSVDVGTVRGSDGRERFFVNGLGLGFNGAVTLESERIRWLRGVFLYCLALLRALYRHFSCPQMVVTIDGNARQTPTLALTVAIGRREGNFVLAPRAVIDDGLFDYLHAGRIGRAELLRYVPGMITGNLPTDHPALWTGRCRQVQVHSEAPLTVHLDGEIFSRPQDDLHDLEIRMLPAALRVVSGKPTQPET
jgi:diacylglycerol kinase family enzyme